MQDDSRAISRNWQDDPRYCKVRLAPSEYEENRAKVICSLPANKALEYVSETFARHGCEAKFVIGWDQSCKTDGYRVYIRCDFVKRWPVNAGRAVATELRASDVVQEAIVYY